VTFEEKIVRWPGYSYTAMTVETHSNLERCTKEGIDPEGIGDGWIATSVADFLLYGFEQPDDSIRIWVFDLPKLRVWFNNCYRRYRISNTDNRLYTTRCRIVPLRDIAAGCVRVSDRLVQKGAR